MKKHPAQSPVDVCLVLEGTYPYVRGGVSTWVHQVLEMFPDLKFSIFYLGAHHDPKNRPKYDLPSNVVELREVYLFDEGASGLFSSVPDAKRWRPVYENLRRLGLRVPRGDLHDLEMLHAILECITTERSVSFDAFWNDRETWAVLREIYERHAPDESFLNFYWTLRFLIMPLWKLARALDKLPEAKLYHTACTGYAGLVAALAATQHRVPLILTEHGIYLRERIADICRSEWIPDQLQRLPGLSDPLGALRRLWIGFFDVAGRMCYSRSDVIISLFEKNARAQEYFGADPQLLRIIPNGITTENFEPLVKQRDERRKAEPQSQVVGFLGRVVSIKDVKTLLRTAAKVAESLPAVRFLIAGPTDEEPEYFAECEALVQQLRLGEKVKFLGPMDRDAFLPTIDVMVLTSISEGLPFVIIESLAAGVPVVSTDVGACAEILIGSGHSEPPAGCIAQVSNAEEIARHLVRLLTEPETLQAMAEAGLTKVSRDYHSRAIREAYRDLYETHLGQQQTVVTSESAAA
jgi:polysaccharide biosynthesis protein PelF